MGEAISRAFFRSPAGRFPEAADFGRFRRQESTLVILNLGVLGVLLFIHLAFGAVLGGPSRAAILAIGVFFLIQTVELIALQSLRTPPPERVLSLYPVVSVWFKLGFAFLIAVVGGFEDSHYAVLMVLPVVAAAFRFGAAGIASVVTASAVLTFLELTLYYRAHPPIKLLEFYEGATIILIYVVVAVVVGYFAAQHRRDEARLTGSLDELERTRDRLVTEEKLAAVGRLSGAIAHEIRNPVAMIVSSAGMLKDRDPGGEGGREMCDIVLGEARRLEKLTGDFLAYARIRAPETKETALADVLGYVAGTARARAAERGLELAVEARDEGTVCLDPFQIQQALLNLIMNAMDAVPAGSRITVSGERSEDGGLVLAVENPGEPLPPGTVDRLFEPFFTTKPHGTGLGLAIARNVARAHGGDLGLAVNGGGRVRFDLRLPRGWAAAGAGDDGREGR